MNLAFYVSGNATRLRKILAGGRADLVGATKLVVSDTERNHDLAPLLGKKRIRFICVEYSTLSRERATRSDALSQLIADGFRAERIDYCFSFGAHILRGELLRSYAGRIINFHPSLLPSFPGCHAIDQAVRAGAHLLGNTAHFVTDKVDAGPIIMQSAVSARVFRTSGYDAVLDLQLPMLYQIHDWLAAERMSIVGGQVEVKAADYCSTYCFPPLEGEPRSFNGPAPDEPPCR